jgi:hypothetical protein
MRTRLNVALHVHRLFFITLVTQTQITHEASPLFLLNYEALQNLALALPAALFCYTDPNDGPLSSYTKSYSLSQLLPLCTRK